MKSAFFLCAVLCGSFLVTPANGFTLISVEEVNTYNEAVESGEYLELEEKSLALDKTAPTIELLSPDVKDDDLTSPLKFELRFEAYGDASIDLDTLKITYGFLNITKRIIKGAEVTESGILARNAEIPPGSYSVRVEIRDTKKRRSSRKFKFTVNG